QLILQMSSAIHHLSNNDNMYIKSYSFSLFSSLPGVLTPVRGLVNPLAPRKEEKKRSSLADGLLAKIELMD
ncbi:hypothetical protein Tco_0077225, partial [Tanacetum coccineum]